MQKKLEVSSMCFVLSEFKIMVHDCISKTRNIWSDWVGLSFISDGMSTLMSLFPIKSSGGYTKTS